MALTDNLVAYYKLDSNSNDSVNSLNGSDTNISYTTAGIIGNGATFNGSNSRISIADNSLLDITGDLTISCWVKTSSITNNMTIVNKGVGGATAVPYEFRFNSDASTSGRILLLRAGSDYGFASTNARAVTNATMTHLVVTASGTTITFYVNGSSVASSVERAIPATITANSSVTEIGSRNNGLFFNGLIDEVGIWSRALSSTEVSLVYNGGAGLQYPFSVGSSKFFQLF